MASLCLAVLLSLALAVPSEARPTSRPRIDLCIDVSPCQDGDCARTPLTGPTCDDGDACTQNDHCEAGVCVGVPISCEDDGFSCTDDVCLVGECTHVPVDSRCVPDDACATSVCAPERAGHHPSGCAAGPPETNGQECAEDGHACTADVCGHGTCVHEQVADQATCTAVESAFRQALALESAVRGLEAAMIPATPAPVLTRVTGIRDALTTASRILAGKTVAGAAASRPGALAETPLHQRARLALGVLVRERPQIAALARSVAGSTRQGNPAVVSDVGRRVRLLLRGTRALRADLRRLLALRGTFVR